MLQGNSAAALSVARVKLWSIAAETVNRVVRGGEGFEHLLKRDNPSSLTLELLLGTSRAAIESSNVWYRRLNLDWIPTKISGINGLNNRCSDPAGLECSFRNLFFVQLSSRVRYAAL